MTSCDPLLGEGYRASEFIVRYYPEVDILQYPWVYFDRYEDYLPGGHTRTGSMDWSRFSRLKQDIADHGLENPFIIEFYRKDLPNAGGLRREPCLAIRTGNNRAEALRQLGINMAPAVFVVPKMVQGSLPDGPSRDIPVDRALAHELGRIWTEVRRGNEEPIGEASAWRDSQLLEDLIRWARDNEL